MPYKNLLNFLNRNDGSLAHKVLRSGIWVFTSHLILNLFSFAKNIVLARLLTPEIFGLMGICLMVIRGVELFTETGFSAALIHRQKDFEDAKDTAFTLIAIRGGILAIIVFSIAPFVASYYVRPELQILIQILSLVLFVKGFANINIIAREKDLDYKRITYLQQIIKTSDFFLVVFFAFYLRNIWALIIGQILTAFLHILFSYCLIPGRIRFSFNKSIAKSLFGYGKYITGLTIVLFIVSEIDNAVIGKLIGMEMLGYYVIAFFLANIPATHISKVASRVLFPAYSQLQNSPNSLKAAYNNALKSLGGVTIPAAVGIAILAPEIIKILYGDKWLQSVVILQYLCIFGACRSISSINGYVYNAIGKPQLSFYLSVLRLFLVCSIIYPLTLYLGIIGTSLSVTIPMVIILIVDMFIIISQLSLTFVAIFNILFSVSIKTFLMSLLILLIKYYIQITNIYLLFTIIIISILFYILLNLRYIKFLISSFTS